MTQEAFIYIIFAALLGNNSPWVPLSSVCLTSRDTGTETLPYNLSKDVCRVISQKDNVSLLGKAQVIFLSSIIKIVSAPGEKAHMLPRSIVKDLDSLSSGCPSHNTTYCVHKC